MCAMEQSWQQAAGRGKFRGSLDVTLDLPLASLGSRAIALLLDLCILLLIFSVLFAATTISSAAATDAFQGWIWAGFFIAVFAVQWGYFFLSEWLMHGQTFGKKLLGLRVVTRDGASPGLVSALVRNLLRVVDFLPSSYGIGAVAMLATRNSQRIGDLAAGTLVIAPLQAARKTTTQRRWPARLEGSDIQLVEAYFERAPQMKEATRRRVAERLVLWLNERYPSLLEQTTPEQPAADLLQMTFPPDPQAQASS